MYLRGDSTKCWGCRARLAITPHFPNPGTFEVRTCTQCRECAEVCPVDCIPQNEKGAYYIDAQECIACGKCAEEWSEGVLSIEEVPDLRPFEVKK